LELHRKYSINKGRNVIFTGYPLFDKLFNIKTQNNPWKKQDILKQKIIWAPHHTIENNEKQLAFSCFLLLYDFMFEVAEKYSDKIQIAFKPHPLLKNKLYNHHDWGISLTNEYYQKWENLSNGQLEDGDYIDLFLTSDAMILDSISFMTEYMVTHKPILFTIRDNSIYSKFNEFGIFNFKLLYKTNNWKSDIIDYIENIVINEEDTMKNIRIDFVKKYLAPPNNITASENIYNEIKRVID
jgi:CDP-glycerol glycerophosphotransferase (TagB/SpsB family)